MTDDGIKEIYALARETFRGGNRSFQIQLLPFRMTDTNLAARAASPHVPFCRNLKEGSDLFEATKTPSAVDVCEKRSLFGRPGPAGAPRSEWRLSHRFRFDHGCAVERATPEGIAHPGASHRPDSGSVPRWSAKQAVRVPSACSLTEKRASTLSVQYISVSLRPHS
jgi:hypothetical protein